MKRTILLLTIIVFALGLGFIEAKAQDNSGVINGFYTDSLKTGTRDTIKATPSSTVNVDVWQVEAHSTLADTVKVFAQVRTGDTSGTAINVWAQRGLIDLSSGSAVSQMIVGTSKKEWAILGSPYVPAFLFVCNDSTKATYFTVSGKKGYPVK
jgi:hypothetical protein